MTTPYGQPQGGYPAPPAVGRLIVDSSHPPTQFLLKATGPKVEINGVPQNVKWGQAPFDLPAGNYNLKVSTRYMGEFGKAYLPVQVMPGQVTTVYYRCPATVGMKGALGFDPQKTRGVNKFLLLEITIALLAIVMILALTLN